MNRFDNVKDAWAKVRLSEIVGWLFFTGILSFLVSHYTIFWKMGSDKLEFSYLIFKAIMILVFVGMGFLTFKSGESRINKGKNEVESYELIRAFSGQLVCAGLLALTLLAEAISLSLRESQLLEYAQGTFYFGIATGLGMMWYLILINHIPKKERLPMGA